MTQHRFAVGDQVELSTGKHDASVAAGPYTVVRLLPGEPNARAYRIKSAHEGHERAVLESQISATAGTGWPTPPRASGA